MSDVMTVMTSLSACPKLRHLMPLQRRAHVKTKGSDHMCDEQQLPMLSSLPKQPETLKQFSVQVYAAGAKEKLSLQSRLEHLAPMQLKVASPWPNLRGVYVETDRFEGRPAFVKSSPEAIRKSMRE